MKTKTFLYVLLLVSAAACDRQTRSTLAPENIADDDGLSVITTSFNETQQTISALYGNAAALKAAAGDSTSATATYRLVTWQQNPHPRWFGSNITGALKSVERVSTSVSADGTVKIDYDLVYTNPEHPDTTITDRQHRIAFILNQKPAAFP